MTNDKSAEEESDFETDDSSSTESDCDDLEIRNKWVTSLSLNNVSSTLSTNKSVSGDGVASNSVTNQIDINSFDIKNTPVIFDDEYILYPSTSTQSSNKNDNIISSCSNMSNNTNIVQNL